MLDLKKDRYFYGELISPPEGYHLTHAIGTTYSLDIYALLAIPVALFYARSMEGDYTANRYDVLDSIRQSAEKVQIFCQRGIKVPKKFSPLLALVEPCITEVHPPDAFSSFHPKIWVLRFQNKIAVQFRLVLLSRNLTFDRSWDLSYFAEGEVTSETQKESKKLVDYLAFFSQQSKRPIPETFLSELSRVRFNWPEGFDSFELYPILGFDGKLSEFPNPLQQAPYDRLLILSPFLDNTILGELKKRNKKLILISREEELDKLERETLKGIEVYCQNTFIADAEQTEDTESGLPKSQNLHAKMFIGENKKGSDWYLGSANCSQPAFKKNAEILVKLSSTQDATGLSRVLEELLDEKKRFFIPYNLKKTVPEFTEEQQKETGLRLLLHELSALRINGEVIPRAGQYTYDVEIEIDLTRLSLPRGFTLRAGVPHKGQSFEALAPGKRIKLHIEHIAITNLSCFLIIVISYQSEWIKNKMFKIEMDIPEEREDIIFKEMINSKEKLLLYLQFLLSPDQFSGLLEIDPEEGSPFSGSASPLASQESAFLKTPLYEYLLMAASRSPEKLVEVGKVIEKLQVMDSEVVEDVLPLWKVFKGFAHV